MYMADMIRRQSIRLQLAGKFPSNVESRLELIKHYFAFDLKKSQNTVCKRFYRLVLSDSQHPY